MNPPPSRGRFAALLGPAAPSFLRLLRFLRLFRLLLGVFSRGFCREQVRKKRREQLTQRQGALYDSPARLLELLQLLELLELLLLLIFGQGREPIVGD
jgi:hypothetical protein